VDAVDAFKNFQDKWCDKCLGLAKWNEKTEMLEEMIKAINVPKIKQDNFYPAVSMVKKLLNDANANV
jgi:hypothetical protein